MIRISTSSPPSLSTPPPLLLPNIGTPTQILNSIVTVKWKRKRSRSRGSNRLIIKSIATIASNLKLLPEPIDLVVREFTSIGGGNGGKFWFRNGSGGGEFDGWRRRKNGRKLGLRLLFLVASGIALLWIMLEKEGKKGVLIWIFWVCSVLLLGVCNIWVGGLNRQMKSLALGFCCGGATVVGLGMKNENYVKWVKKFRVNSLVRKVIGKRTWRNRRAM